MSKFKAKLSEMLENAAGFVLESKVIGFFLSIPIMLGALPWLLKGHYQNRSLLDVLAADYIDFPGTALGESPWNYDQGKPISGPQNIIAFGIIHTWVVALSMSMGIHFGLRVGILAALLMLLTYDVAWRKAPGALSFVGSIVSGAVSAALVAYCWYFPHIQIDAVSFLLGWIATGILNVRFSHHFWGNPMVGYGTGAFVAFVSGPIYWCAWLGFLCILGPCQLLASAINWYQDRKKAKGSK